MKAPSHRLLAMLRAENEGFIKLKIEIENEEAIEMMEESIIKNKKETAVHLKKAIEDSYKRLLSPAISNETLQEAKAKADITAIQVFAGNLGQLLLAPPLGEKEFWLLIRALEVDVKWFALMKKAICYITKRFFLMRLKMKQLSL